MKLVTAVTVEWNMSDIRTVLNIALPPGMGIFAMAYAAIEAINKCPVVPTIDVNMVLNRYLEKGTQAVFIRTNRSLKFFKVGFVT